MKIWHHPVRATLLFGLIGGLSTYPLCPVAGLLAGGLQAFYLILWLQTAVYGILLMRWAGQSASTAIFPLAVLLWSLFWIDSAWGFFLLASGILSWIRSVICFPKVAAGRLMAECAIGLGASVFVAWFPPHSVIGWATAIWIFFLNQTFFFVFFDTVESIPQEGINIDPFERVRAKAEEILTRSMP